uniref:Malectin-like domain-containing protein n=1 Tax=Ananas comosus var. bracteatus TaxID=296719 RepID=A0A6V7NLJ1_ANACO|nr:unnamed protein product [Ananas comosus var. bracteatus]
MRRSPPLFSLLLLLLLILILATTAAIGAVPPPLQKFDPRDNYLLDCGAPSNTQLDDGRTFRSDPDSSSFLSTPVDVKIAADKPPTTAATSPPLPRSTSPPASSPTGPPTASSSRSPAAIGSGSISFRFRIPTTTSLPRFSPSPPTTLRAPTHSSTPSRSSRPPESPPEHYHRRGGGSWKRKCRRFEQRPPGDVPAERRRPLIVPLNDTLARTWIPDAAFLTLAAAAEDARVPPGTIKYPDDSSLTPLTAPAMVYATAQQMARSNTTAANFNITWEMAAEPGFSYLVRLHFCDIVSKTLNSLYFNVYLNGLMGVANLDLSSLTMGLAVAYYTDFVLDSSAIVNSTIMVQVGPSPGSDSGNPNAILNGIEVMKMSNGVGSLDGLYSVNGKIPGLQRASGR